MLRRWILYLSALSGCVVFFLVYRQWMGWLLLMCVLCLPIVSLLTSLPAMLKLKLTAKYPERITVGEALTVHFSAQCPLPVPALRYLLRANKAAEGREWLLKEGQAFPTEHCGKILCKLEKTRVYDYLGLFWLGIQKKSVKPVLVMPVPVQMENIPDLERYASASWRPKPGGGFSENHELRQYIPGDKMNQVHWKLTAKTGQTIVREPMEPAQSRVLLEMELWGTPEQLDKKFGQLLWLSDHLLQMGMGHELRVLTGSGVQCCTVENGDDLKTAMDFLLGQRTAPAGSKLEPVAASWRCRIGGGEYEA